MKLISLIDHEVRRVAHDDAEARPALASDLYAALQPLRDEIRELRGELSELTAKVALVNGRIRALGALAITTHLGGHDETVTDDTTPESPRYRKSEPAQGDAEPERHRKRKREPGKVDPESAEGEGDPRL